MTDQTAAEAGKNFASQIVTSMLEDIASQQAPNQTIGLCLEAADQRPFETIRALGMFVASTILLWADHDYAKAQDLWSDLLITLADDGGNES